MDVYIEESTGIKRASGTIRHGAIYITVPKRWPRQEKDDASQYLKQVLLKRAQKEQQLLNRLDQRLNSIEGQSELITFDTVAELTRYVRQLNQQTFNVPLAKVRIGQAKFSRLAQMNIQTRIMTVSKYCLKGVPEPALRYLIVHELAHLLEANHSKRFWNLVAEFVPDYKYQSDIMKAFHKRAVDLDVISETPQLPPATKLTPTLPLPLSGMANRQLKPLAPNEKPAKQPPDAPAPTHLKRWWQLKLF